MVSFLALTRHALERVLDSGLRVGGVPCRSEERNVQKFVEYEEGKEKECRLVGEASMWDRLRVPKSTR